MVWGMTDGRTYRNISENPQTSFLFKASGAAFSGVRLALELMKTEGSDPMLEKTKENADATVGPGTGAAVSHAAWFTVTEVRPLI